MPTLAELETRVRDLLDEPTSAQWSQAQIRSWLNEANFDLARTTRHLKSTSNVLLIAGQAEYLLSPDILSVEHAYYNDTMAGGNRDVPLVACHWENMDQIWGEHQGWEGAWPQMYTVWGFSPNLRIRFYPVPSIQDDQVNLLVSRLPVEMPLSGQDTDVVDVPTAWYDALADYCTYRALMRDRQVELADRYLKTYEVKRETLLSNNDYLAVNREMVPDPRVGYVPWWIAGDTGDW